MYLLITTTDSTESKPVKYESIAAAELDAEHQMAGGFIDSYSIQPESEQDAWPF